MAPTKAQKEAAKLEKEKAERGPNTEPVPENADVPEGEEEVPTEGELNFPVQVEDMHAHSPQKERAKIWAKQEKAGTVTLCKVKGENAEGEEIRCYYPLTYVRDPANHGQVTMEKVKGVLACVAQCSFDPKGHGKQYIFPPKKEDEL